MKINVVLYQPEIPQNTGNIMRTCVATQIKLHLIKPYGFDLDKNDRLVKRNSANYLEDVEFFEYENYEEFIEKNKPKRCYYLTRYGQQSYDQIEVNYNSEEEIYFMFGSESSGIDKEILKKNIDTTFRIPMAKGMRSLNLSNCVALVVYEAFRQMEFKDLEMLEPHKKDFLK